MARNSRSAGPADQPTAVERGRAPGGLRRGGRGGGNWPWLIVGVGLALGKGNAVIDVVHHRAAVLVLLAVGLAFSVLRPRPVMMAMTAAPLLAFSIAPRSTATGVALGLAAFGLLLTLFIAVGTVLHARQDRDRTRA